MLLTYNFPCCFWRADPQNDRLGELEVSTEDGRHDNYFVNLQDLPTVVEAYKTYDDVNLVKVGDVGQVRGLAAAGGTSTRCVYDGKHAAVGWGLHASITSVCACMPCRCSLYTPHHRMPHRSRLLMA